MDKKKNTPKGTGRDGVTKKDLKEFKEEILHQFHIISEGLIDQIKLLAEGHSGIIEQLGGIKTRLDGVETRLDRVETRLDHMVKENERQHLETRSLVKISFSELDRRLSNLESRVNELQEWRKEVEARLRT
jgi:regulator of replication initiation timing